MSMLPEQRNIGWQVGPISNAPERRRFIPEHGGEAGMRGLVFAALTLLSVSTAGTQAFAQQRGTMPHLQLHAVNPSMSLSAPTSNPLQQQMQDNYATGLIGAQRELLQQNPSGLGRQELAIGHQLNGFTGPR
jgi:hypothetical protein